MIGFVERTMDHCMPSWAQTAWPDVELKAAFAFQGLGVFTALSTTQRMHHASPTGTRGIGRPSWGADARPVVIDRADPGGGDSETAVSSR